MAANGELVVIFDDYERGLYRDHAAEIARQAGLLPQVFDEVEPANRLLAVSDDVLALVTALGTRGTAGWDYAYPARPLLATATRKQIPIALLSGHPKAAQHIDPEASDIVVPKQPYERIAPALREWFNGLLAEPA